MAGLNDRQNHLDVAETRLHLTDADGEGKLIYAGEKTGKNAVGYDVVFLNKNDAIPKNVKPCQVILRHAFSPDTIAYYKANGLTYSKYALAWISDKKTLANGKKSEIDLLDELEIMKVRAKGLIIGFDNIPFSSEDGAEYLLENTQEHIDVFIDRFPSAIMAIIGMGGDAANFPQA